MCNELSHIRNNDSYYDSKPKFNGNKRKHYQSNEQTAEVSRDFSNGKKFKSSHKQSNNGGIINEHLARGLNDLWTIIGIENPMENQQIVSCYANSSVQC